MPQALTESAKAARMSFFCTEKTPWLARSVTVHLQKRALTPHVLYHRRTMPNRLRAYERVPSPRVFIRSLSPNGSPTHHHHRHHHHPHLKSPSKPSQPPPPPTSHADTSTQQPAPKRNEAINQRHRRPTQTQQIQQQQQQQRNPINVAHRLDLRRSQKEAGIQSYWIVVVVERCCRCEHSGVFGGRSRC